FFFQAEDGIRDFHVTGVQTCALPICEELKHRIAELIVAGVKPRRIIIDPGLGFAKNSQHNWQLLGRLDELTELGYRVLIGASRKIGRASCRERVEDPAVGGARRITTK